MGKKLLINVSWDLSVFSKDVENNLDYLSSFPTHLFVVFGKIMKKFETFHSESFFIDILTKMIKFLIYLTQ